MISQTIFLDVYNIKAEINSSDLDFLQFVLENYPCFNTDHIISPNIVVNFSKFHGEKAIKKKKKLLRISKDLYRNQESIYWENEFGFSGLAIFPIIWNIENCMRNAMRCDFRIISHRIFA